MTTTNATRNLPPIVKGALTEYRLWTVQHIPFDRFERGNPPLVVIDDWSISTESGLRLVYDGFDPEPLYGGMVQLNAHRIISWNPYQVEYHELHLSRYATRRDAERAAYEAGLMAYMIYTDREASLLPEFFPERSPR